METFRTANLKITTAFASRSNICYLLYPMEGLEPVIEGAAQRFGVTFALINGMDWDDDLTPWPAKGEPPGCPDFKGNAAAFLSTLQTHVLPETERRLGMDAAAVRTLVGVSLSGLFTLWQWMLADTFRNIISLSGSFWYAGFADWVRSRPVPRKSGRAYFLLGNQEARSRVRAFQPVQGDTTEIVAYLRAQGVDCRFELVPGNHYQYAEQRLARALAYMFGTPAGR